MQPLGYIKEHRHTVQKYSEDGSKAKAVLETTVARAAASSVQRQPSLERDSGDLNLTASLETFVAGIQGLRTEESSASVASAPPETENRGAISSARARGSKHSQVGTAGGTGERSASSTMQDYGRSGYMQSAVGSVFPEAYANSYVVAKEGESAGVPAPTTSYQVVLSDGVSYPSAVFPTGEREHQRNFLLN